jgi:predicted Zn-dependent peptidase
VVVGVAGDVDAQAMVDATQSVFGSLPQGEPNRLTAPDWVGGVASRRLSGSSQAHIVLGYPIPSLEDDDPVGTVAAALFGEGMSSPLLDRIRERLGLAYYTACSADVLGHWGQFVIEASTAPEHLDEYCAEVRKLLRAQARGVDAVQLERARNQIAVRSLRSQEQPFRRVEEAALDLLVHGRVRPRAQMLSRIRRVSATRLAQAFEAMLAQPVAAAVTGRLPRGARERVEKKLRR